MGAAGTTEAAADPPVTVIVRRKLHRLTDAKGGVVLQPRRMQCRSHAVALGVDAYPPFRLGP